MEKQKPLVAGFPRMEFAFNFFMHAILFVHCSSEIYEFVKGFINYSCLYVVILSCILVVKRVSTRVDY